MSTNSIQGSNALIYFYTNAFTPFGCATDFTLTVTTNKLPIRTVDNTGVWKSFVYQDLTWSVNLSGVTVIDSTDHFDTWDILQRQLNFVDILCQITYTDDGGTDKSIRGNVTVDSSALAIATKDVVKSQFTLTGNGTLIMFDGDVPCDSTITGMTFTGGTGTSGTQTTQFSKTGEIDVVSANTIALTGITTTQNIQPGMFLNWASILYPITGVGYLPSADTYFIVVTGSPTIGDNLGVAYTIVSIENGNVTVTYTYTGLPAQVKYRVDNAGNYIYVSANQPIVILSPTTGEHQIEIIPVCTNDFEGTGLTEIFDVTNGATCSSVITAIIISGTGPATATNTYTGSATTMRYRIDSGPWVTSLITTAVSLPTLSIGSHSIEEQPICENGALGTSATQTFSITTSAGQSIINYSFAKNISGPGSRPIFGAFIRVNGVLFPIGTGTTSGTLTVNTGDVITVSASALSSIVTSHVSLSVSDTTTSTTLYTNTHLNPYTLNYTFTAMNGDSYSVVGALNS